MTMIQAVRRAVPDAAAGGLAAMCLLAILAKFADWLQVPRVPGWIAVIGAVWELLVVVLLCAGWRQLGAWLAVGFSVASCTTHITGSVVASCRCLGNLALVEGHQVAAFAAVQGSLAILAIVGHRLAENDVVRRAMLARWTLWQSEVDRARQESVQARRLPGSIDPSVEP